MTATPGENAPAEPAPPAERDRVVRRASSRTGVYAAIVVIIVVVLVVVVGFQYHWFGGKSNSTAPGACPSGTTLQGNGANFILALVSAWQQSYNTATGNRVDYTPGGAGAGITALQQYTVDFAATDDPLNSSQTTGMHGSVLTLPITGGALAIVYNLPGLTKPISLTGPVLADIYLGKITMWNDPAIANNNTGLTLPPQPIGPVVRSDAAGTTYVLTDFLSQDSPTWASSIGKGISVPFPHVSGLVAIKGNSALASYVQTTSYTIGYVDLTDVLNLPGLQYAKVLNPAGVYVLPTVASTASAIANRSALTTFPSASGDWQTVSMVNSPGTSDYPLATLAYFFVYKEVNDGFQPSLAKAQVLVQWLNYVITTGQSVADSYYYVALSSQLVTLDTTALQTMTFNGASIPTCG